MKVSLVAAVAKNGVIGKENALPWRLPLDLKRFKEITLGHPIIMGRKTFESIGKPLPGRENIVISRNAEGSGGAIWKSSLEEAIEYCRGKTDEAFVIGGAEIYRQALPIADRLYLTLIDREVTGDRFFPEWTQAEFQERSREDHLEEPLPFSFVLLERAR